MVATAIGAGSMQAIEPCLRRRQIVSRSRAEVPQVEGTYAMSYVQCISRKLNDRSVSCGVLHLGEWTSGSR